MAKKKQASMSVYQEFRELKLRELQLTAELEDVQAEISEMKEKVSRQLETDGIANFKLATGETVYPHIQYWAKRLEGKTKEDVIKALRKVGLGHIVTPDYNANTLSGLIREMIKQEEEIPKELEKVITIAPTPDIRIRGLKL